MIFIYSLNSIIQRTKYAHRPPRDIWKNCGIPKHWIQVAIRFWNLWTSTENGWHTAVIAHQSTLLRDNSPPRQRFCSSLLTGRFGDLRSAVIVEIGGVHLVLGQCTQCRSPPRGAGYSGRKHCDLLSCCRRIRFAKDRSPRLSSELD